jgi:small ligand-binding sensory domain FIST
MPFAAALSTNVETVAALDEVSDQLRGRWTGDPDLAFLFFTPHHADEAEHLAATTQQRFGVRCLLGCTGESIVGNEREIEWQPALSLWLGRWSADLQLEPFFLVPEKTPDGYSIMGLPDSLHEADAAQAALLLLADPFTFPADLFLQQLNETFPGLRVMGGMASGGRGPGDCRLIVGEKVREQGAVGVLLQGPIQVRSIVSQGCRPIGTHYVITKARDNVILELGGKPPLAQLQQLWQELPTREQRLFQQGLHVGRVINEYQGEFHRGDFLVRNVLGLDSESGALAITERVRVGQTVQFHVRDADSAAEDLHALLQMDLHAHGQRPGGALLFTCNGRGTRLFSKPNHDTGTIRAEAGEIPVAGFFAQGELGPIGGQNFIHGFTASVVLFED